MPVISGAVTVVANTVSANVLAGDVFEFAPPQGALVNFLATMAVIGLTVDILVGGEAQALGAVPPIRAAAAPFPVKPEDSIVIAGAAGGARLFMRLRNCTGGEIIAPLLVEIAD